MDQLFSPPDGPRTKRLRLQLNWTQRRMGEYLGLAQSGVVRLEHGQRERGAIAKLLDQLERETANGVERPAPHATEAAE